MTLAERITMHLVDGRTKAGLARACGIKQPSVSDWMSGRTKKIEGANLLRAAGYLGVTPEWLATGRGVMAVTATEPTEPGDDFVAVSRVQLTLSAGVTGYEIQQIEGNGAPIFFRRDYLETRRWKPDRLFALKVSGDSMEPALFDGDLVVVNTADTTPADGEVFAINYEGQAVIKRLRRDAGVWWIDSDNPRHKSKQCDEHAILIGRVCYRQTERI